MNEPSKVYSNAPVVEAVIDVQVEMGDGADACLVGLSERLQSRFPRKDAMHQVEMQMRPDGTTVQTQPLGWRLASESGDRVLQLRRKGFTYSHMPPYTQWSRFSQEARGLWEEFLAICAPTVVTRMAVRYINRLKLPAGPIQMEDYLAVNLSVPPVFEPIKGILLQIQGAHAAIDPACGSFVTIASEPAMEPGFQSFLLDIDVFLEKRIPSSDGACWGFLERLRVQKNELFEAAITENLRGTFK